MSKKKKTITMNIRMSEDLRNGAELKANSMGLSMSALIRMLLSRCIGDKKC